MQVWCPKCQKITGVLVSETAIVKVEECEICHTVLLRKWKIKIAVEDVMRIQKERRAINSLNFADIIWTYRGKPIKCSKQKRDDFGLCGLNNMDFITSNYLTDRPWQKDLPPLGQAERE